MASPRKLRLAILLVPIAGFAALFLVPIGFWNPGAPGLASGKVDLRVDPDLAAGPSWLGEGSAARAPARARYVFHEGGALHIDIENEAAKITLILHHGLFGKTSAAAVVHAKHPAHPEAERRPLTGVVTLRAATWGTKALPTGTFRLRVAHTDLWQGAFAP